MNDLSVRPHACSCTCMCMCVCMCVRARVCVSSSILWLILKVSVACLHRTSDETKRFCRRTVLKELRGNWTCSAFHKLRYLWVLTHGSLHSFWALIVIYSGDFLETCQGRHLRIIMLYIHVLQKVIAISDFHIGCIKGSPKAIIAVFMNLSRGNIALLVQSVSL